MKTLACGAALLVATIVTLPARAQAKLTQTKQDITFHNQTKYAAWVTTYSDDHRGNHLAHGCVPAKGSATIGGLSVGREIVDKVWLLVEVKGSPTNCSAGDIQRPTFGPFSSRNLAILDKKTGGYEVKEW